MNLITFEVLRGKISMGHCIYGPGDRFTLPAEQAKRWVHTDIIKDGFLRIVSNAPHLLVMGCMVCGERGIAEPVKCMECGDIYMMCRGCLDGDRCPSCDGDFGIMIERDDPEIDWDDVSMSDKNIIFEWDDEI